MDFDGTTDPLFRHWIDFHAVSFDNHPVMAMGGDVRFSVLPIHPKFFFEKGGDRFLRVMAKSPLFERGVVFDPPSRVGGLKFQKAVSPD